MIDIDDLPDKRISLFTISHASGKSQDETGSLLNKHVINNEKYVLLYEYSNNTSYDEYIQTIDMVYSTIWNIREEQAAQLGFDYNNMTNEQEKELRKKYPITLTMKNTDED